MAATHFSGPVVSPGGFQGPVTGGVTGAVAATTLTTSGAVTMGAATITIDGANLIINNLPTADPTVAGQLWSNSGVLTVSAG